MTLPRYMPKKILLLLLWLVKIKKMEVLSLISKYLQSLIKKI